MWVTKNGQQQEIEDGTLPYWRSLGWIEWLPDANAAYLPVFNVTGYGAKGNDTGDDRTAIQAAIDACSAAGGGVVYLPAGTYRVFSQLTVPNNVTIKGAGMGATSIKRMAASSLIENADQVNGNSHITICDLSLDGNKANVASGNSVYLLNVYRTTYLTVENVEAHDSNGPGIFVTGNGTVTEQAFFKNLHVHDNGYDGMWVSFQMRRVIYEGVYVQSNGHDGIVFDHSEANASGIYADSNGRRGIWIRNVFGCSYTNLAATRNGQEGIWVESCLSSVGTNWRAQHNGTATNNTYADIMFTSATTASPNYGITQNLIVTGVQAGHEQQFGSISESYGIWVDDTVSELKLFAVNYSGSGSTGNIRVPASPGNLVVIDTTAGTAHARQSAGDFYIQGGSFLRLIGVATASRPAASTAGKGAQHYDTTLNRPIWSDGTNWKDSAGTIV